MVQKAKGRQPSFIKQNKVINFIVNSCVQLKLLKCVCKFALVNDFEHGRLYLSNFGDFVEDMYQLQMIFSSLRIGITSNPTNQRKY